MKIVIDIDEREWMNEKSIREVAFEYKKGSGFDRAIREGLRQAIVLPKGHGRLIDADALIKQLEAIANNRWNIQVGASKGLEEAIDIMDDAPTIIEAESEEEE